MKKAAMVLGIVGGSLAILIALVYLLIGIISAATFTALSGVEGFDRYGGYQAGDFATYLPLFAGVILGFLGGGLGLAGGILVPKRNVMAGVFMLVGSVVTALYCITFILLVLGGIFALVKEKENATPAV